MTKQERDEKRAIAKRATPGPWNQTEYSDCGTAKDIVWAGTDDCNTAMICKTMTMQDDDYYPHAPMENDAAHIAAFDPLTAEQMLDALNEKDAEIARLQKLVDVCCGGCEYGADDCGDKL